MIVEGSVTIKQDGKELQLKNHLTAATAMFLFRFMVGASLSACSREEGLAKTSWHLMRTFQIRLGTGMTQVPAYNTASLQNQKIVMVGNTDSILGSYANAAPFDKVYSAQVDAYALCSAVAGVTINHIEQSIVAITNDPPSGPTTGGMYIVGGNPTGDFVGHNNEVATWDGSAWTFETPANTWAAHIVDLNESYRFDGTTWVVIPPIRECGLFTYGYADNNGYRFTHAQGTNTGTFDFGNSYFLAAYISANGGNPDFNVGDINLCKSLVLEWTLRISFAGDE